MTEARKMELLQEQVQSMAKSYVRLLRAKDREIETLRARIKEMEESQAESILATCMSSNTMEGQMWD